MNKSFYFWFWTFLTIVKINKDGFGKRYTLYTYTYPNEMFCYKLTDSNGFPFTPDPNGAIGKEQIMACLNELFADNDVKLYITRKKESPYTSCFTEIPVDYPDITKISEVDGLIDYIENFINNYKK